MLKLLGGSNHFFFGNAGGLLHPQGRVICFHSLLIIALALHFTGNTSGQGVLSQVLDALPLEKLGSPNQVYDNLSKLGVVWCIAICHPSPVAKFWSKWSGASVAAWQSVGAVGLTCFGGTYAAGFGCFNFNALLVLGFVYGIFSGFAQDSIKNQLCKRFYYVCHVVFVSGWLEAYNAGYAKITNFQSVMFTLAFVFGVMAWTSRGSGGNAGGKRGRTRSRSKRR